jgi:hypothetical protein
VRAGFPNQISGLRYAEFDEREGDWVHRVRATRFPQASHRITLLLLGWAHQVHMADAKRIRQFVDAHDGRVPPTLLEAADVLLAETGALCQLLLREASVLPDSLDVSPDQLAHIHAPEVSE